MHEKKALLAEATGTISTLSLLERTHQTKQARTNDSGHTFNIKHQKSSNTGVAPFKNDGHLTSDPKAQAELLNEQFQSVLGDGRQYTAEEFELKTGMADRGIPTIGDIKISEQGVKKFMENLSLYKAGGPDGISPQVLRELAEELAPALTIIFQSSLSTGIVPADWRDTYVTAIFKKNKQYNPGKSGQSRLHVLCASSWSTSWSVPSCSTLRPTASSMTTSTAFAGGVHVKHNSWSFWKNWQPIWRVEGRLTS